MCKPGRNLHRAFLLPPRFFCRRIILRAEEEGLEPTIPRSEVFQVKRLGPFRIVIDCGRYATYLNQIRLICILFRLGLFGGDVGVNIGVNGVSVSAGQNMRGRRNHPRFSPPTALVKTIDPQKIMEE